VPRLLCCTDTYLPQVNGVSVVTGISVSGLEARGWECTVVAPRYPSVPPPGARRAGGETMITLPSFSMPRYPEIRVAVPDVWRVRRAIRDFKPDLVHCATEFSIGAAGMREARRAAIPVVTSYHTDFARYTASYGMPWLRETVMRHIVRFHRRAARTYTPGSPARDDLVQRGVRDVEVWGRGVDTSVFSPTKRDGALRAKLGAVGRCLFVHVSRLAPEKGTEIILDAYRTVTAHLPPRSVHLVIAGEGPERERLRARAPEGVTFLGFLDRETELPALYATADAFCFASTTETLGLVVLEAMASGTPVLAAPAGGVADHLRHRVNGISYPARSSLALANAMIEIAQNAQLRSSLSIGARQTAELLTWERERDRLDASYREVLALSA